MLLSAQGPVSRPGFKQQEGADSMTEEAISDPNIIQSIKAKRQGATAYRANSEILERVREYEKAELAYVPGAREAIDKLSLLDPLTELYNFRTFIKELKAELNRAKRYKKNCSVCFFAIDNYEDVTTQYGYLTGDAVMRVVANVLRSTLRETDIAAKYAPSVFVIVYPQTNAAAAAVAAERIRKRVANQAINHNWQSFSVTASLGVASFPIHAETHDELLARGIEALEYALERGGDRVLSA
jgi:diguanylate cyclase (GGDEF)-like protein